MLKCMFYYDGRVDFSQVFQMQNFNKFLCGFPAARLMAFGYSCDRDAF